MLITSQHYLDPEIVAAKLAARDFEVLISPEFELDGERYQTVLDGHHSLAAAIEAGVSPDFEVATVQMADTVALLADGNVDDFLAATWMGGAYIDAYTGKAVW